MAFNISDLNGAVVAPNATYPYGYVKNSPTGTRVDTNMVGDLLMFLQRVMATTGVTPNGTEDNATNGFQAFLGMQKFTNNYIAQLIISLIGTTYDPTKVYILYGAPDAFTDGMAFYNSEIFYLFSNPSHVPCSGPNVQVITIAPTLSNNIRVMQVLCAASGSGISDFDNVIYFQDWQDGGTLTFTTPTGGSVTVDPADVKYNRYKIIGKTLHYQLQLLGITISGTPSVITVDLPFVTAPWVNDGMIFGGVYNTKNELVCQLNSTSANGRIIMTTESVAFTNGTNNQSIFFSFTTELP